MEKLYYSKGVNKAALIGSIISIIAGIIIGVWLFSEANTTVKGFGISGGTYMGNGVWNYGTPVVDKYDESTQQVFYLSATVIIIVSVLEVAVLALKMRSWTEIYQESIKANVMGKAIACRTSEITSVSYSKITDMLILTGPTGNIRLIVKEPEKAQNIIRDLMYNKVSVTSSGSVL